MNNESFLEDAAESSPAHLNTGVGGDDCNDDDFGMEVNNLSYNSFLSDIDHNNNLKDDLTTEDNSGEGDKISGGSLLLKAKEGTNEESNSANVASTANPNANASTLHTPSGDVEVTFSDGRSDFSSGQEQPVVEQQQEDGQQQEDQRELLTPCPYWSEVLTTPTSGDCFSPSKDMNKSGSLHGYGLTLAAERSKVLSRCGRRCVSVLLDVAYLYENLAQSLFKTCSSVELNVVEVCPLESIQSFAQQIRWLATCIKDDIALPLQDYYTNMHGDTIQAMVQKFYAPSRQKSSYTRQTALLAKSRYVKAVRDAEIAWRDCHIDNEEEKITNNDASSGGAVVTTATVGEELDDTADDEKMESTNEKEKETKLVQQGGLMKFTFGRKNSYKVATKFTKEIKQLQGHYEELVKEENRTVQQAQIIETMVLEALQKLEEQRVLLFVQSIQNAIAAEKSSLDNMDLSLTKKDGETKAVVEKKGKDFFTNLLNKSSSSSLPSHEDGMGKMEAETLGLPTDVGELRDEAKAKFVSRDSRIQAARTLSVFLEDISNAATKFSASLKQVIKNDASKTAPGENLNVVLAEFEGARAFQLWTDLVTILERESEAAAQMARSLRSISSLKLNEFLFNAERNLKNDVDAEDAKWKHLCDAARTESRAEARYRQTTMQAAKVRERAKTVEDATTDSNGASISATVDSPRKVNDRLNKANERMSKAVGKMFSILPDGGEQAMQILRPDARRAVAQRNVKEADEKESKDRQLLDAAAVATSRALDLYRNGAKHVAEQYEQEEKVGWEDVKNAIESLVSNVDAFRIAVYESLENASSYKMALNTFLMDQVEWTQKGTKDLEAKVEEAVNTEANTDKITGFMLSVELEESEIVSKMFSTVGVEKEEPVEERETVGVCEEEEVIDDFPDKEVSNLLKLDRSSSLPTFKRSLSLPGSEVKGNRSRNNTADSQDFLESENTDTGIGTETSIETRVFVSYFAKDAIDILDSYSCAFIKDGQTNLGSITHGRLFVTSKSAYFVGWLGKKANLKFAEIVKFEKKSQSGSGVGAMGASLFLGYAKGGKEIYGSFGCFLYCDEAFQRVEALMKEAKVAAAKELENAAAAAATAAETKAKDQKANATKISGAINTNSKGEFSSTGGADSSKPESDSQEEAVMDSYVVPPDPVLKEMEVLLAKNIKNVSIKRFYEIVWSEGYQTDEKAFYKAWLENGGCYNIEVSDWETGEFSSPWDKEVYPMKRSVKFHIRRKGLYVGPAVIETEQEHYCRLEGADRCILLMNVMFHKIPYSDCFTVQVRWVASREGPNDVKVECGVHVHFVKSTILKGKIRSGTIAETRPTYINLFEWANRYCKAATRQQGEAGDAEGAEEEASVDEEEKVEDALKTPKNSLIEKLMETLSDIVSDPLNLMLMVGVIAFIFIFRAMFTSSRSNPTFIPVTNDKMQQSTTQLLSMNERIDELQTELKLMHNTLAEIAALLKDDIVEKKKLRSMLLDGTVENEA